MKTEKIIYIDGYTNVTSYDDNLIKIEHSDGSWIKYEYDENGNLIKREHSDGSWYKYEYDDDNLIKIEHSDGRIIKKGE